MNKFPIATENEIAAALRDYPRFQGYLYSRGYIITDKVDFDLNAFPFYGLWRKINLTDRYYIYFRDNQSVYKINHGNTVLFLIGHAYNPFSNDIDENIILGKLALTLAISEEAFWKDEGQLSGIFLVGFVKDGRLVVSPDCAGMRIAYYGVVEGHLYISSHSKLIGDLCGLKQDPYVVKLTNTYCWRFFGRWLPGDLSPYKEFKRLVPDHKLCVELENVAVSVSRYYPFNKVEECTTEEECQRVIEELVGILHNSLELIAKKWPEKTIAISVTGGRDSTTTLACANGLYEKFRYFSYISNFPEKVDAEAASKICTEIGLEHDIYSIPDADDSFEGIEAFRLILLCNTGCIGWNNPNDVRKRLWFCNNPQFDIEVKSWLNEMGRGSQYTKFGLNKLPKKPTPGLLRTMHKIYLRPDIIHETNRVFSDYIAKYLQGEALGKIHWSELFWREFSWSGYEGPCLTSEHLVSYDITIPFNNRLYIEKMLSIPLERRLNEYIPTSIVCNANKAIADTGIVVKDIEHTGTREKILRVYLKIFSKI